MKKEYISADGHAALQEELRFLLDEERPRVVNNVAAAAAEGDRSENAEYIYGKKRLREIDKRLEFLSKRLDAVNVVEPPADTSKVRFLHWVLVEDAKGVEKLFRIVGADETDAKAGLISYKSPVGRALLGKTLDDNVPVRTPGGLVIYTVLEIEVERPTA